MADNVTFHPSRTCHVCGGPVHADALNCLVCGEPVCDEHLMDEGYGMYVCSDCRDKPACADHRIDTADGRCADCGQWFCKAYLDWLDHDDGQPSLCEDD